MLEHRLNQTPERALLVHQHRPQYGERESLEELRLLAGSAGAEVVDCVESARRAPHPATYVGTGKVEELRACVASLEPDLVVINHAISPVQERNLERALGCRVLDRTGLILDIFAQRAASHEGKLQVELAQLRYLSTRLVRGWTHLERQKGGIGLRGPGETQLETDRRLIGDRIRHLRKRLLRVSAQREVRRRSRRKVPIPTICLVGYTNAGKSSLFNRLTGAAVLAEDRLFATLDPTMRRLELPENAAAVVSDTVGFIRSLPHSLVKAFHSTLEEVGNATLLLHVVDSSSDERQEQVQQVDAVLEEIGAADVPRIMVYNKIDLNGRSAGVEQDGNGGPPRVWLSAATGEGIDLLLGTITARLRATRTEMTVRVPPAAARIRAFLFEQSYVRQERYAANGDWIADIEVAPEVLGQLRSQPEYSLCAFDGGDQAGATWSRGRNISPGK